jgi:hypothetical protein
MFPGGGLVAVLYGLVEILEEELKDRIMFLS